MALISWLQALELEPDGSSRPYDIVTKDFRLHPLTTLDDNFPQCCEDHLLSFQDLKEWAKSMLPEEEASLLAKKTLFNLSNTESFILFTFNQDDWYEEISDFIEYNIFSFGSSIYHAQRYLMKLGGFIKSIQIPNNYHKSRKLDQLVLLWLQNSMFSRDLLHLRRAFDKWFHSFPFELSLFKELKDKYDLFFGIANDDFTDFDDESFTFELNKLTDAILYHHNTSNLYNQGLLTDPYKLKLELITSQRLFQYSNDNFYGQESDNDPLYKKMIKKWFEDEIKFVDDISKHKPNHPPQLHPTKKVANIKQDPNTDINEIPPFESLFSNPTIAEISLQVLRILDEPILNHSNVYIGKNKGAIPAWIQMLKAYPQFFNCNLTDKQLCLILNEKIFGLNLSQDASEFRKDYKRISNSNIPLQMKALFSKLSQSSQKGKLGK